MKTLVLDIPGLDLVLSGGLRLLERAEGAGPSATILVRGPAGSGKTLFAVKLAGATARALKGDVAYCCVELLPEELKAQHAGVTPEEHGESVVVLGDKSTAAAQGGVRICAGLLDLGDASHSTEQLGAAVKSVLDEAARVCMRRPAVLVIDSLSEGYGLGASVPRIVADALCKLALQLGLVAIFVEEVSDERPSIWPFVVDTVLELRHPEDVPPADRSFVVPKHRFGPAHRGPHRFSLSDDVGLRVLPHYGAYTEAWAPELLKSMSSDAGDPELLSSQDWCIDDFRPATHLPPFRSTCTAIVGKRFTDVRKWAEDVGADERLDEKYWDIMVWLGGHAIHGFHEAAGTILPAGLTWSPELLLTLVRELLIRVAGNGKTVRRFLIGDIGTLAHFADREGWLWAIATLVHILHELEIPLVLFETVENPSVQSISLRLADVGFDVSGGELSVLVFRTAWHRVSPGHPESAFSEHLR